VTELRPKAARTPWWARTEVAGPWFKVGTDEVRLLRDGVEALPAMLEAIKAAKREIILAMYWVGADAVGTKFREALAKKAQQGVTVSIICATHGPTRLSGCF